MTYDLRVLSLGAGTQSSALLMMALRGDLPPEYGHLDAAIFADTGDEPQAVYDYLELLTREAETAGVPVYVVRGGDGRRLADYATDPDADGPLGIPAHIRRPDGTKGMARRQCTRQHKLRPIRRQIHRLIGGGRPRPHSVQQWIGLSVDEVARMKPSGVQYVDNVYPLVEMGWPRQRAIDYLVGLGMPTPPRSACVYCPFRSDQEWRDLRDGDPDGWAYAVEFDQRLRDANRRMDAYQGELFLHASLLPLAEADLSTPEDRGQWSLFTNECEGLCGV